MTPKKVVQFPLSLISWGLPNLCHNPWIGELQESLLRLRTKENVGLVSHLRQRLRLRVSSSPNSVSPNPISTYPSNMHFLAPCCAIVQEGTWNMPCWLAKIYPVKRLTLTPQSGQPLETSVGLQPCKLHYKIMTIMTWLMIKSLIYCKLAHLLFPFPLKAGRHIAQVFIAAKRE